MIRRTLLIAGLTLGVLAVAPVAQAQSQIQIGYNKRGGFGVSLTRLPVVPAYPVAQVPVLPAPPVVPAPPIVPAYPVAYPPVPVYPPVVAPVVPDCHRLTVVYLAPCGRWEIFGVYHSHRQAHAVVQQLAFQGVRARVLHS